MDRQALGMRGRVGTDLGLGATEALGRLTFLAFYSVRVLSGLHLFFSFLSGVRSAFQKTTVAVHGGFLGRTVGDGFTGWQRSFERWQRLGVGLRE